MGFVFSDLTMPCDCAAYRDGEWFLRHPDRLRYLRGPWECEQAQLEPEHIGLVSQIVCVHMERSLNATIASTNLERGLIDCKTSRRSFIFWGKAEFTNDSDEAVDQFLLLVDGEVVHGRAN